MAAQERLFDLSGRVALVTGGRHGVGRALALAFARAGANVAVTGRRPEALAGVAAELEAAGAEHLELELELADAGAIERAVEQAAGRWERLDVVVNNAGVSVRGPAEELRAEDWDAVLATDLRAPFLVARAAAAYLTAPGGRIINLSSTFARVAVAGRAPYAAAKAGLEQLTRALALEWAPRGITVNAIAPGVIPTETRAAVLATPEAVHERTAQIPLGRLGAPDDLVGAALLLAGDAGAFITGQTIVVDGGYSLGPA